jgi:hypothetical protein
MKKVVVQGDDWCGLYVDGKLVYENHSIPLRELAKHLGFEILDAGGEDAFEPYGYRCPETLAGFKFPKKSK